MTKDFWSVNGTRTYAHARWRACAHTHRCRDCGMTDVIAKPISRAAIVHKIKHWVEKSAAARRAASGAGGGSGGIEEEDAGDTSAAGGAAHAACSVSGGKVAAGGAAGGSSVRRVLVVTDPCQRTVCKRWLPHTFCKVSKLYVPPSSI